jgi:hypothetical protein
MIVQVERWVLGAAIVLSAAAGLLWGSPHAVGSTAAGGLLAFVNLVAVRRTVVGILSGSSTARVALGVVLVSKLGLLLAAVWLTVRVLGLDPAGVALGLSALIVGIVGGTLLAPSAQVTDRASPGQ